MAQRSLSVDLRGRKSRLWTIKYRYSEIFLFSVAFFNPPPKVIKREICWFSWVQASCPEVAHPSARLFKTSAPNRSSRTRSSWLQPAPSAGFSRELHNLPQQILKSFIAFSFALSPPFFQRPACTFNENSFFQLINRRTEVTWQTNLTKLPQSLSQKLIFRKNL